jgi:high-affinity Fe2+/Pb2+ permease
VTVTNDKTARSAPDGSLSAALHDLSTDLSRLVRQEVELKQEASTAAKGIGMLAGAGVAALLAVVLGSIAAAVAIGSQTGLGWGFLIVTAVWLVLALVLMSAGRSRMRSVSPAPTRTLESLKEDAQWARHPTS